MKPAILKHENDGQREQDVSGVVYADNGPGACQGLEQAKEADCVERLRRYIAAVKWQESKTMRLTCPHEYTIRGWRKDLESEFIAAVLFIREQGYEAKWRGRSRIYYEIDGFKYWTMGDPIDNTWVLNREPSPTPCAPGIVK